MARVHPTAVVAPGAKLADDVGVGPYSVVGPEVELGPGVWLDAHVVVSGPTRIGPRTRVHPFCTIGGPPQVVGATGSAPLRIGADNVIREYTSIHCGTLPEERDAGAPGARPPGAGTRLGDGNFLLNNVHVAHDCRIGSHCVLTSYVALAGHAEVQDRAVLGGRVGVHQHCRIGAGSFTGAGTLLRQDVPPFGRVLGERPRLVGVDRRGLARWGCSEEGARALRAAYRILLHGGLRLAPALERIEAECGGAPEVDLLVAFCRNSARGVIRR